MTIGICINEIYEHIISIGPSNKIFSNLRFRYYAKKLKQTNGKFYSCSGFVIERPENITIGNNVFFNRNVFLAAVDHCKGSEIIIGDNCLFGPNVVVVAGDHDYSHRENPMCYYDSLGGKIVIGDDCWIGANTTITRNVTIGTGSIIGANSVVTKNIPPYTIAVGVPARAIKSRFGDKYD